MCFYNFYLNNSLEMISGFSIGRDTGKGYAVKGLRLLVAWTIVETQG